VTCLQPMLQTRYKSLQSQHEQIAGDKYRNQPFDLGGLRLEIRDVPSPHSNYASPNLFLGDRQIAEGGYRIEPRARYRNDLVDALAFVLNAGGIAYHCENSPVYVIANWRNREADVLRVPGKVGGARIKACPDVRRTAEGFLFIQYPGPLID